MRWSSHLHIVGVRAGGEQLRQGGEGRLLVGRVKGYITGGMEHDGRLPARSVARRDGGVLAAGTLGLVVRRHGMRPATTGDKRHEGPISIARSRPEVKARGQDFRNFFCRQRPVRGR